MAGRKAYHRRASDHETNGPDDETTAPPSKTRRKREAHRLRALGERLVALPAAQLERIPLPQALADAVAAARAIRQRGARRRQLQYIGKLMRAADAEPIAAALEAIDSPRDAASRAHRRRERLCTALLAGDAAALERLAGDHPDLDRGHLMRLVREAGTEGGRPSAHRRALYRYLRSLEGPLEGPPED